MAAYPSTTGRPTRRRVAASALLMLALLAHGGATGSAWASADAPPAGDAHLAGRGWVWPVASFRLEEPFVAPAHRYGPGHRGIDLRPEGDIAVSAPAAGNVAFAGSVAGRGVVTIDHGDGLVTTFEPIDSDLSPGEAVGRGDAVGTVSVGGHTSPGALHFGVRLHGEYVNPLLLLEEVPRAVLLPCC